MTLVVKVEQVARMLGLAQPLEEADRWLVEQAIADAQSDLEAYLGRPVSKGEYTQHHLLRFCGGFHLKHFPVHEIISTVVEAYDNGQPTGYWTVTYVAGLDGEADPELEPIRRFIRTHAAYSPLVQSLFRRLLPEQARKVTNLSVEGQSVTYGDAFATEAQASELGLPGGLPSMKSCDRWRIAGRMPHMAPTQVNEPWPYENRDAWWWRW